VFQRLFENLGLKGILAEQPMKLANLVLARPIIRRRHHVLAAAGCGQAACATNRRQVNNWFGATPCRRATRLTVIPGSKVSSTIRTFSETVQRRRR